ncbi:MAG: ABC transporter permease [Alphaproteobacteria bacterium]|nr:ABC transporter permease [Alphaproteobacteria bacterium]
MAAPGQSTRPLRRLLSLQTALVLAVAVILLALWEASLKLLGVPGYIIPAPSAIATAFQRGLSRGLYAPHIGATATAMVLGYAIGAVSGVLLGGIVAEFKLIERVVHPYIVSLQFLPKIALAPLFVMWFGYGVISKVVMVTLICFFPLMVNTMTGILSADRDRLDIVRTMTATRWQLFWHVKFPSAAGHIFAGLQVAVVLSLIGALVGEFV